jgi:lycopene cyclase domain-containing protein
MQYEYLLVLGFTLIIPLIMSFNKELKFYRNLQPLFFSIIIPLILYLTWDYFAIQRGHWNFALDKIVNIFVFNIPIEEILFFIIIPFVSLFVWESVKYYTKEN